MIRRFLLITIGILSFYIGNAQILIHEDRLKSFVDKIKADTTVSQILFLGDSHIQADILTAYLREKFQEKYGNAGRGIIFPYRVAKTNGGSDYHSYSNTHWWHFKTMDRQKLFPNIGASGYVLGNNKDSFLEFDFLSPLDSFSKVLIFNALKMRGERFEVYGSNESLKNYVNINTKIIYYKVRRGQTISDILSKFNTNVRSLRKLNRRLSNIRPGRRIKVARSNYIYNNDFEKSLELLEAGEYDSLKTEICLFKASDRFILKTMSDTGNIFYGFQFLNNRKKGVIFNTVGINGATYKAFLKYPFQLQQLLSVNPDIVIIALGTNESIGKISKAEFKMNVETMISRLRAINQKLPILLISPTDNRKAPTKVFQISQWLRQIADSEGVAYLDMYKLMGGRGYFRKAQLKKSASRDGVHFMVRGYQEQAEKIWRTLKDGLGI